MSSGVYVLELEGENYYVGMSKKSIEDRISTHFNGNGSAWTKLHAPVSVKETVEVSTDIKDYEKWMTKKLMLEFGWESVRGAAWCETDMSHPPSFCV